MEFFSFAVVSYHMQFDASLPDSSLESHWDWIDAFESIPTHYENSGIDVAIAAIECENALNKLIWLFFLKLISKTRMRNKL